MTDELTITRRQARRTILLMSGRCPTCGVGELYTYLLANWVRKLSRRCAACQAKDRARYPARRRYAEKDVVA